MTRVVLFVELHQDVACARSEEYQNGEQPVDFPIIVGSGVKTSNVLDYFEYADAVIVGRGFKTGDRVDEKLVREFMDVVRTKY